MTGIAVGDIVQVDLDHAWYGCNKNYWVSVRLHVLGKKQRGGVELLRLETVGHEQTRRTEAARFFKKVLEEKEQHLDV